MFPFKQKSISMPVTYLSLGSNMGDRSVHLSEAVCLIDKRMGPVLRCSSLYETEPWGFEAESCFLNMVVEIETELEPDPLLQQIQAIESMLGRKREGEGYQSRPIDIDILFYEEHVIWQPDLMVPHPLMQDRRFVLAPLCDLAPALVHPIFNRTVKEMLRTCKDPMQVHKVAVQACAAR